MLRAGIFAKFHGLFFYDSAPYRRKNQIFVFNSETSKATKKTLHAATNIYTIGGVLCTLPHQHRSNNYQDIYQIVTRIDEISH